jgi:DNA-binding MarR family transcriptional regulator
MSAATIMFHQAVADRLGLNPTDHKCADLLILKGAMTAGELANLTGLTTGAITGVIDRLEKAGFVRREDDPNDRRRVIVRALPKRLCEVGRLFEPLAAAMAKVCSRYSDRELAIILDFQTRAQEGLREATLKLRGEAASAVGRKRGKARTCGPLGRTTELESEPPTKTRETGR